MNICKFKMEFILMKSNKQNTMNDLMPNLLAFFDVNQYIKNIQDINTIDIINHDTLDDYIYGNVYVIINNVITDTIHLYYSYILLPKYIKFINIINKYYHQKLQKCYVNNKLNIINAYIENNKKNNIIYYLFDYYKNIKQEHDYTKYYDIFINNRYIQHFINNDFYFNKKTNHFNYNFLERYNRDINMLIKSLVERILSNL